MRHETPVIGMKIDKARWRLLVKIALVLVCVPLVFHFVCMDYVSRPNLTRASMAVISRQIGLYASNQGTAPDSLQDLQRMMGEDPYVDAWGRPLLYSKNDDRTVTFRSLGRDGARGGSGEDADIARTFRIDSSGTAQRVPSP